ncbi:MAG: 30S ribosomal protein S6 [Parcubacteria group bacterium]|nr:30S ribosomal protein S6 [Parcubacteria group bacterium]
MTELLEDKTLYELGFLINGELTEEEARGVKKSLEELLGKYATISEQGELVMHNLAYRIIKRKTAYFSWIRFHAPTPTIGEIKESLRYNKNLIRTLLLKLNKKQLAQETHYQRRSIDYTKNKEEIKTTKGKSTSEKETSSHPIPPVSDVDVQELDKRLAEIL